MDYQSVRNLSLLYFERARQHGDRPFLWAKHDGKYQPLSWREVDRRIRDLSRGLRALGIEPGDRVVVVSENRPEWLIADLAVIAAGGITVPAYITNTTDDHVYILDNSSAKAAIVSTAKLAQRVVPAAQRAPTVRFVVGIEEMSAPSADAAGTPQGHKIEVHRWDEVARRGAAMPDDVEQKAGERQRDDIAFLIYTSGTGGNPKGVMLSHRAILANCMGAHEVLTRLGLGNDVFLSFLPLSHSYEHTAGQFFPISIGAEIYYAEGAEGLSTNFLEAKPTIVAAVPRLYEVLYGRIMKGVERASPLKQKMFHKTLELGRKRYRDPTSLSLGERALDALLERLVRTKVRARFGGRLKAFVSGGAPLNVEVGEFFTALGLRILQGYGQTEAAPVISCNPPQKVKIHTVGPPFTGVQLKIAEDGEILVKGDLLMNGYWGEPEATAAALKDGWLHTGDIGHLDEDGYLQITDRKKDIIVNSGGDNVSPARVEGFLTLQPEIGQAMVYGDKRPHLVAVIVPNAEWLKTWAAEQGKPAELAQLSDDPALQTVLSEALKRVNAGMSQIERVRSFIVAPEAFTTDNGMMTPTLKIRRHKIKAAYAPKLEALYERG
ncbi:MAG: long-chain fatty acid--CoA ligase [Alphaproteobacteria bacterium]|nr:long-chain fatty acid--CoA ligase [Alphaproteobacteria bacterium]